MTWTVDAPPDVEPAPKTATPAAAISAIPQPAGAPSAHPPARRRRPLRPEPWWRGDFLSRMLHQREITPWTMLLGLAAAFVLGAAHALTPGHGKTSWPPNLVGSRGT